MFPSEARKIVFSATYSKKSLNEIIKKEEFVYVHTLKKEGKLNVKMTNNIEEILSFDEKEETEIHAEDMHLENIKKYKLPISISELSFF